MEEDIIFDIGKWENELSQLWSSYLRFYDLINRKDLLLSYTATQSPYNYGFSLIYEKYKKGEQLEALEKRSLQILLEPYDEIKYTFSRLMIVSLASIIEFMINNFFLILFNSQPYKMVEYNNLLDKNKDIPVTMINKLLKNKSLKIFIADLSKRNAMHASSGEKEKVFKRLVKLSKFGFNNKLLKSIKEILDKRNLIVHDYNKLEIKFSFVYFSINIANIFLKSLALASKEMGLPYKYPYDEGIYFLDDISISLNKLSNSVGYGEFIKTMQEVIKDTSDRIERELE